MKNDNISLEKDRKGYKIVVWKRRTSVTNLRGKYIIGFVRYKQGAEFVFLHKTWFIGLILSKMDCTPRLWEMVGPFIKVKTV